MHIESMTVLEKRIGGQIYANLLNDWRNDITMTGLARKRDQRRNPSTRTTGRYLKELENEGLIERKRRVSHRSRDKKRPAYDIKPKFEALARLISEKRLPKNKRLNENEIKELASVLEKQILLTFSFTKDQTREILKKVTFFDVFCALVRTYSEYALQPFAKKQYPNPPQLQKADIDKANNEANRMSGIYSTELKKTTLEKLVHIRARKIEYYASILQNNCNAQPFSLKRKGE
jgi:hypothetical protein